jgi:MFS family permease
VLLAAVAVFAIGSLVCAVSSSMGMLIAGRAVQGAAAGGLMILVNICVSDLFSMRDRSLFYGMLEFVWATAGESSSDLFRPETHEHT